MTSRPAQHTVGRAATKAAASRLPVVPTTVAAVAVAVRGVRVRVAVAVRGVRVGVRPVRVRVRVAGVVRAAVQVQRGSKTNFYFGLSRATCNY